MKLVFFIRSKTVKISKYNIKDLPGSTGRLDVISRCILAALVNNNELEEDVQIWTFLDNYGTFVFDSESLSISGKFPMNELKLADHIVKIIKNKEPQDNDIEDPLQGVVKVDSDIFSSIKDFKEDGYEIYSLNEGGDDFTQVQEKLSSSLKLLFIIGNQSGDFLGTKKFLDLEIPGISFGSKSYLASSVIRLIKLNVLSRI